MFASFLEKRLVQDPGWQLWGAGGDSPNGTNTQAGESVTADSALKLLAVFGSISFIADLLGQLPTDHYRKVGGVKSEVNPKAVWLDSPNPESNGQDFQTQFTASLLWAGNAYVAVLRTALGQVGEIWLLDPSQVTPRRDRAGAPIEYWIDGQPYRGEIQHTRAFTLPGQVVGCNPISYARETIGAGLAQQSSSASFYANGSIPSMVITSPQGPELVNAEKLKEGIDRYHRGAKNSHGTLVLTGGATAQAMTISPEDAQFLEGQNYNAAQIVTNLFRIPPDLLGYAMQGTSAVTYQNLESRWTDLRRRCLGTWITKYERAMSALTPRPQFVKLNDSAFLRGDEKTQYDTFAVGITNGFLTRNEAREKLDYPPLEDDTPEEPPAPASDEGTQ